MILLITIAYAIGIIWGLKQEMIVLVPFLIAIFLFFNLSYKTRRYLKCILKIKLIIIFFIAFIIGVMQIRCLEDDFNNKYKGIQELNIIGTIVSNPKIEEYKIAYVLKIENNRYLLLNVKKENDINLRYGDKVHVKGEYKEPNLARNYGGFSYKDYLKTKKIYGTITCKKADIKLIKANDVNIVNRTANNLSNTIIENVNKLLPKKEANLLVGILIGNKDNLDENINEAFRNSNLSHMLAVSGAHVSYIILGLTLFFTNIKINKKISKIITILFLLFFIVLVGGMPSVTRACIMAIYVIFASIIYKKPDIVAELSISMMIILINNPYSILDIGMKLSYGGTIGIVLFANKFIQRANMLKINNTSSNIVKTKNIFRKILSYIKQMLIVSVSANIIILPIIAYNFNTVSLTFFISNILAGPILGIIVILGFIFVISSFVFMPLAYFLSFFIKILLQILIQIAQISSQIPLSKIYVKTPNIIFIISYYLCIFLLLRITSKNKKYRFEKKMIKKIKTINYKKVISILIVIIILFQTIKIFPKNLEIYFIDVGQGDSTLIITPYRKKILIDGGGSKNNESFDVGQQVLLPYLLDRGITRIDYCIISHFDSDHVRTDF